jgi:uncharacterized protein (DUF362 family)
MKRVGLVKGDHRKENIRRALELIHEDVALRGRRPLIKVNFVSTLHPLSATPGDAVRGVVEFLKDRGEKDIAVVEGATWGPTSKGFRELGYYELAREYGVELIDLNDSDSWKVAYVIHPDLKPCPIKLFPMMVDPGHYIISLTRLKVHHQVGVTLTAKNVIMGSVMITDRPRMHPTDAGTRVLDYNLFMIMPHLHIDLGVLDGFEGMEGNGPMTGDPVDHRVAIAGADFLAVDRVGTEVMGFDFDDVRYLNYLWDNGFGQADLNQIEVLGETIQNCRKPYKIPPRFFRIRRQEKKGQYQDMALDLG